MRSRRRFGRGVGSALSALFALGAGLSGCTTASIHRDPTIPGGIREEEEARFETVSRFVQSLPPDANQIEQQTAGTIERFPSPDDRALFLLTILRLQVQLGTEEQDIERMTACWSAARRLLRAQGVPALRSIVSEIRASGGMIPGAEEVLIEIGPPASRLLVEILQEPYPQPDKKDPFRREREVQARGIFVHALGKIASPATRSALEQIFLKDAESSVRYAARSALVRMRDQQIVNTVCGSRYLTAVRPQPAEFAHGFLIQIYNVKRGQLDYGRNSERWLAAFDNAYYQMDSPVDRLLDCFSMPDTADERVVPAVAFARWVLADATGRDLGDDPVAWGDYFRRQDQEMVRLLVKGLSDGNLVNRDAVREDLVRITRGQDFAYSPQAWIDGLTQIGWLKEPEKK